MNNSETLVDYLQDIIQATDSADSSIDEIASKLQDLVDGDTLKIVQLGYEYSRCSFTITDFIQSLTKIDEDTRELKYYEFLCWLVRQAYDEATVC